MRAILNNVCSSLKHRHRASEAVVTLCCVAALVTLFVGQSQAEPTDTINIEVDYMVDFNGDGHSHGLLQDEIDALVQVFACEDILLNIEVSDALLHVENIGIFSWITTDSTDLGWYLENHFDHRDSPEWYYCLMAHSLDGSTASGANGGTVEKWILVTLGAYADGIGTPTDRAGTFLHELGHTFGLLHAADQDQYWVGPQKPNYVSVMSYAYQFGKIKTQIYQRGLSENLSNLANLKDLDYSHGLLPALDEKALIEAEGIGYGPVDWNCNEVIDAEPVRRNLSWTFALNSGYVKDTIITDYDDWSHIKAYLAAQRVEHRDDGGDEKLMTAQATGPIQITELEIISGSNDYCGNFFTFDASVEIEACVDCIDIDGDGYGDPADPDKTCPDDNCLTIYNPGQEDSDENGIGDACQLPAPVPILPEYGAYLTVSPVTFRWHTVPDADQYQFEVTGDSTFNSAFYRSSPTPDTSRLLAWGDGLWYWRVRAWSTVTGKESDWSDGWPFSMNALFPPHLITPPDAPTKDATPTFTWTSVIGATAYNLEMSTSPEFTLILRTEEDGAFAEDTVFELNPSNALPLGAYYWRARGYNPVHAGQWSETGTFEVVRKIKPSCPVLFAYNGLEFTQENPLLTACEQSGYKETVTDYYLVRSDVGRSVDGSVKFQLREMEDEISYINDFELITVDHSRSTRVSCATDGRISTFGSGHAPLAAVDNLGVDRLEEILAEDGHYFTAEGEGYLTLTFPHIPEGGIYLAAAQKKPCNIEKDIDNLDQPGELSEGPVVEILDENNIWVLQSTVPARTNSVDEFVAYDFDGSQPGDAIQVRISWADGYSVDYIRQFVSSKEQPVVLSWKAVSRDLKSTKIDGRDRNLTTEGSPITLVKGDVLEVGFDVDRPVEDNLVRDYIIKAVGRYEPDYSVYEGRFTDGIELFGNHPNPFNPTSEISFSLPHACHVNLEVFNIMGQRITTLVNRQMEAGYHTVSFDGGKVASGVLLYRIQAGDFVESKKMMLVK